MIVVLISTILFPKSLLTCSSLLHTCRNILKGVKTQERAKTNDVCSCRSGATQKREFPSTMALAVDHQWLRLWSKSSTTRRLGLNARFAAEQTIKLHFGLSNRRPLSCFDGIVTIAIANAHETLSAKASKLRRTLSLMPRASLAKQSLRRWPHSGNLILLCFAWKPGRSLMGILDH